MLVSFTALSIFELELICLTVQRWSWVMIGTQLLSVLLYWLSLFCQLDTFSLDYILSGEYYAKSAVVILCSGGVVLLVFLIYRCVAPDEIVKLHFMQEKSKMGKCSVLVHSRSSTGNNYFNIKTKKQTTEII